MKDMLGRIDDGMKVRFGRRAGVNSWRQKRDDHDGEAPFGSAETSEMVVISDDL